MSDKLNWMNRHFVLVRHVSLQDVVEQEKYKPNPEVEDMYSGVSSAGEMVWKFADAGRWKCACELLAYMSHRRAAVWWAYLCLLSLNEELGRVPAEDRDIADIATSFEPTVPDFARIKPAEPDSEMLDRAEAKLNELKTAAENLKRRVNPEVMADIDEALAIAFEAFKKEHGHTPLDLLEMALEKEQNPMPVDENSPIFKAADQLEDQLNAVRRETIGTIKSVLPPKIPAHEKKQRDNALQAVYRWIVAPDEINSQKALDAGNECPDTPAGLLALCAFWAFGNLMPAGEQIVPTPPGLAANGISQVLLMCALHKGGTRKLKERYEHYFRLGLEVMTGENNWDKNVRAGEAPHTRDAVPGAFGQKPPAAPAVTEEAREPVSPPAEKKKSPEPALYHRWKPALPPENDI